MTGQLELAFDDSAASGVPEPMQAAPDATPGGAASSGPPIAANGQARHNPLVSIVPPTGRDRPSTINTCIAWLQHRIGSDDPKMKEIRGAVATIARVLHRLESRAHAVAKDLPARPDELRPLLRNALPTAFRLSASRWSNAMSHLTSLLIAAGWVSPATRSLDLAGDWGSLVQTIKGDKRSTAVRPFLRFCARRGVLPPDISAVHLGAYEEWLTTETLDSNPRQTVIAVQTAWRRLRRTNSDWPQQDITTASRVWQKAMTSGELPMNFEADVLAFMEALRHPDPLDERSGRPMAELSVQHMRRALMRAATYLVGTGVSADRVVNLAVLVEVQNFKAILLALHREGKPMLQASGEAAEWTRTAEAIAGKLVIAARRWVRVSPAEFEALAALRRMVKPRRSGLSERVQDRLSEFATEQERAELHALPWRAFEVADRLLREGSHFPAAKLHETALALAILLYKPLRCGNVSGLDMARHFVRDRRGQLREIAIPATEVKNRVAERFTVNEEMAFRIERHIAIHRPRLLGHEATTALFPGEGGGARKPGTLGRQLKKLVRQQLGKEFHPHLARHLLVDQVLEADPRNLPIAQKVLGHRRLATTEMIYGGRVARAANLRFTEGIRASAGRIVDKRNGVRRNRKGTS